MVMKMCTCTSERTCRTWLILFRLDLAAAPGGQAGHVRGVLQRSAAAYSASRRTVDVRRLVSRVSAHARVLTRVAGSKCYIITGFFSGFFQVGKGKKSKFFPGGEKRKLGGILPEKHAILHVKKLKNLFLSKISGGGGEIDSRGSSPPALRKKNPALTIGTLTCAMIQSTTLVKRQ